MLEKKITIKNKLGMHARAAVKFVNTANRFSSTVRSVKDGDEIQGTEIILKVSGKDEDRALSALVGLINNNFSEKE